MFNSYNNINTSFDVLPKQFLNYINYELSFIGKISHWKNFT